MCSLSHCLTYTLDNDVSQNFRCRHRDTIHTDEVDGFEYIPVVNDDELKAIVAHQPVRHVDISFYQILIVGYGFEEFGQPYWIIQCSYGKG
ncbi:unnamed protein product [Brassica rapa subsp. trilocularis]